MEMTREQFVEFTTKNIDWIHVIERHIDRRLTDEEVLMLKDMIVLNGWENYVEEQKELMIAIHTANSNFMEGISNA